MLKKHLAIVTAFYKKLVGILAIPTMTENGEGSVKSEFYIKRYVVLISLPYILYRYLVQLKGIKDRN